MSREQSTCYSTAINIPWKAFTLSFDWLKIQGAAVVQFKMQDGTVGVKLRFSFQPKKRAKDSLAAQSVSRVSLRESFPEGVGRGHLAI